MTTEQDAATHGTGQPPVADWTTDYDVLDADYVPDLQPADVDLRTRALSDVCLALFNAAEFSYVY